MTNPGDPVSAVSGAHGLTIQFLLAIVLLRVLYRTRALQALTISFLHITLALLFSICIIMDNSIRIPWQIPASFLVLYDASLVLSLVLPRSLNCLQTLLHFSLPALSILAFALLAPFLPQYASPIARITSSLALALTCLIHRGILVGSLAVAAVAGRTILSTYLLFASIFTSADPGTGEEEGSDHVESLATLALALHLTLAWFLQFLLNDRAIRTAMRVHQSPDQAQTMEGTSGLEVLQSWAGAESTMISPETMLSDFPAQKDGTGKPSAYPFTPTASQGPRSQMGRGTDDPGEMNRRFSTQSGRAHASSPSESSIVSTITSSSSSRPLFLHGVRPSRSSYEMSRPQRPSGESTGFTSINHETILEYEYNHEEPLPRPQLTRVTSDPTLSKERRSQELDREEALEMRESSHTPLEESIWGDDRVTQKTKMDPEFEEKGEKDNATEIAHSPFPSSTEPGSIMSFVTPPPASMSRNPHRPLSPPVWVVGRPGGSKSLEMKRSSRSHRSPSQRVRISMRQENSLDLGSFGNNGLREEDEEEEEEDEGRDGVKTICKSNIHERTN